MNLNDLNPPVIELPKNQRWFRIQRTRARADSVRLRGFNLPPVGSLSGRFDLQDESTAYLAESELTALYEAAFRREVHAYPLAKLKERALACFRSTSILRLVDLRGLEVQFPLLQSLRYATTRTFAAEARELGVHGIIYASAQHPHHSCVCLFRRGLDRMERVAITPLVQPKTGRLHRTVVDAVKGSQVPIA